ncbi:hypothetical protein [Methylicorpusculum sp.]|uniref:hypothetical protein n=1 Tax=Methylicorpusculum sp. TaxID=2713644 RepID=UPI002727699D|nr:hypothetical protein [Methylicorpusculum sp.]MDO8846525.1 hypothetical protein [Methylicorpusculum sp.]MDP2179123.1 hypothetical protein [Methylicorpusculum sp.]MDP3527957.1 hypothetical protein [Methylicorpusculum sp.]MDZ4151036.1 hypothetical protein [Methylicorpusculum sp.]
MKQIIIQQPIKSKLIAATLTCLISLITITPLCGFLFQCGCNWPWLGLDAGCNYYKPHAEHTCPWCASMITGILATGLATLSGMLAATLAPLTQMKLPNAIEVVARTSLGLSLFLLLAVLTAAIAAVSQAYPLGIGLYLN